MTLNIYNRDEFVTMPDETLKNIYKSRMNLRSKISVTVMASVFILTAVYFVAGFFHRTVFSPRYSNSVIPVLMPIFFFIVSVVSALLILSENISVHSLCTMIILPLQLLLLLCEFILGIVSFIEPVLLVLCAGSHIIVVPMIKDIEALRACPSFPFDNWKSERKVSPNPDRSAMKEAKTTGFEDIVFGKKRSKNDPDPSEFFQSHDMINYNYLNRK